MRAVDIIIRKRDGAELSRDEIRFMVRGYTEGEIADYQMSALVMAIFLRGMTVEETLALTEEMLHSGEVLDFSDLGRPRIDKHSTGGVGDKTSLVIAPVVGAAGVLVPMISGRALAHSGGTLDKLEAIPGFRTDLSLEEFRRALENVGVALIGQTDEIAPADKKLYALRDVTGTVPCIPLIAGSIMSKKLAEGINGLVLDVKVGSGAFMKDEAKAMELARLLIKIASSMKKDAVALVTDMSQPLGRAVGNALETVEAFEALRGRGPDDFITLCRELSAEMLLMGRAAPGLPEARELYDDLIRSGAALEKMREIIASQGGNASAIDDYDLLGQARLERAVVSSRAGFVQAIETEQVGRASMLLGAGRLRLDTRIDLSVGLRVEARIGDRVEEGSLLATLVFNDESRAGEAAQAIERAYTIGPDRPQPPRLIKAVLRGQGFV
jgi:pyrimidine-nucleoside phosphorylase